MPDRPTYTSDEIESCRDNCDALLAAWAANDVEDGTLEAMVFTQAVVVLDAWFAGPQPSPQGTVSGPIGEVRAIADSVVHNGGVLRVGSAMTWVPERTVLRLVPGDEIEVTANGYERLAAAYLAAIEATHAGAGG